MGSTIDTIIEKTRNVADATVKVAGEVMDASKSKLKEMRLRSELKDAYARLGNLVYESGKSGKDNKELLDIVTGEIDEIKEELEELAPEGEKKEVKEKYCPSCGATNGADSDFCCKCGAKLG